LTILYLILASGIVIYSIYGIVIHRDLFVSIIFGQMLLNALVLFYLALKPYQASTFENSIFPALIIVITLPIITLLLIFLTSAKDKNSTNIQKESD